MKTLGILALVIVVSVLSSFATSIILEKKSEAQLIEEFYLVENAVHVSPHSIRKMMDKGDQSFILVDLRSQEEYEAEHIIGAVSIPAYKDKDTSAYDEVERIVNSFSQLEKDSPNKDIIVYCYSIPCMTGRKIGKMLTEKGIYVKHLGVGWNEWKYYWTMWNHAHEWNTTKAEDYTWVGSDPGIPERRENSTVCKIGGDFGC